MMRKNYKLSGEKNDQTRSHIRTFSTKTTTIIIITLLRYKNGPINQHILARVVRAPLI